MADDTDPQGTQQPSGTQPQGTAQRPNDQPPPPPPDGEQGRPAAARIRTAPRTPEPANTADDDEEPEQTLGGRIVSWGLVLLSLLILALVIWKTDIYPRTDDAEVLANFIGMSPLVNGPITQLNVRDNQMVHVGEVMFRIDDRPYKYALENAISGQATLEGQIVDESRRISSQESAAVAAEAATRSAAADAVSAAAAVHASEAEVANSEAALARAQADYTYSVNNLHRVEPLLVKHFVTVDEVDQLRTGTETKALAVRQAQAQVELSKARLASNQASFLSSQSRISQSHAQRSQASNAVTTLEALTGQRGSKLSAIQNAQYNYDNCTVRAPFDGRVTDLTISNGEYAHNGQQVFTLIDTRVWWVIANFRETQLHRILPGMHVDVYLLSDPTHRYRGVVDSASYGVTPDSSTVGRFSTGLPDAQRTLSWVHLASRYPVRVRILDPEPNDFRISQSAVVVMRGWRSW